jgi:preprotein translocase subunit Sss1
LNDGDITRSNRYIKKSLEDANFYNARLRNIQIAKILPVIDKAYQMEREEHQQNLLVAIVVIGILVVFLIGLVIYLVRQMNTLAKTRKDFINANKELKKINLRLSETNHIKEEYIGRFLNQCSVYIDKLEAYRKALNKKASGGKLEELYQMLKSSQIIEDELKEFYQNFDSTFLNLFPDFVEEFNKLLPEEDHIIPKSEPGLSVELRIFALIRLGITDSAKIAGFLRYSITTIYNYRSKYRNKSLIPREKFEETVMKIGYFNS